MGKKGFIFNILLFRNNKALFIEMQNINTKLILYIITHTYMHTYIFIYIYIKCYYIYNNYLIYIYINGKMQ